MATTRRQSRIAQGAQMSIRTILVIVAVILFALAALAGRISVKSPVDLVAAGLAVWALSTLV